MSYRLGIDLGTTYTAAAVTRPTTDGRRPTAEIVNLGDRAAQIPSVLHLSPDGTVLVGEAAERRVVSEPDRVVREFKRQVGDLTPIVVDGVEHTAHDLMALLVGRVVDQVAQRQGGRPDRIAVTHPAPWGPHKVNLIRTALQARGLEVELLDEPRAAALSYAATERVEPGSVVAVYDLGGGTFDAAVVRKNGGFTMLGRPEGIERLGGVDFDDAVFTHVRNSVGKALDQLDPADEEVVAAVARLRRDCVEAKEALSSDTEVRIPVLLPGHPDDGAAGAGRVRGDDPRRRRGERRGVAPGRHVRRCRAGGPDRGPAGRWLVPDPARRAAGVGGPRPPGRRRRRSEERDRARRRPGRLVRPGSGPHGGAPGRRPHDPGSRRRGGHRRDPPARAVAPARAGSRRSDRGAAGRRGHAARRQDRRWSAARHDQPRRRRAPHPDPRRAQRAARSAATGRRTRSDRGSR